MKRTLAIAFVAIVLVGVAALVWLSRSLDGLVEGAIEQVGSELLGTRVSVSGVSIDLGEGRGTIRGIRIDNPRGEGLEFSPGAAFSLEEIVLELDLGSLASKPIVLDRVRVAAPQVDAELRNAALNLEVIGRHLGSTSASEVDAPQGAAGAGGAPIRLRVRRFEFAEGAVHLDTGQPDEEVRELRLPSFTMKDVGGAAGAEPGSLGKAVLGRLVSHAATAVAQARARGAAEEWLDRKLEDRPAASEAAKKVLEGLLGGDTKD